jgi:hypothetical protein
MLCNPEARAYPFRISDSTLPTHHKWRMLSRVLQPLVHLQNDPELSLEAVCKRPWYSSPRALNRATRRLIGYTPSEIRKLLGWEWVVDHFLGGEKPRSRTDLVLRR